MPGSPRFETRRYDGRVRIRYWDGERERYVYLYRLNAVAWGILESLADERHVDHIWEIPWLDVEWNLEAKDPDKHSIRTQQRRIERENGQSEPDRDIPENGRH